MIDIFDFWSLIGRGEKIHPADVKIFERLNPKAHGFELGCLPGCFNGPLRTAPVVLLYLSPGFARSDLDKANSDEGKDAYLELWKGRRPLSEASGWTLSRTKAFGEWENIRHKVAILNIGAYHSHTFNDYSVLAALPSSRVSLEWAQSEAEAGKRVVICMRAHSYWGLERGQRYGKSLFAPEVARSGHLARGDNRLLIEEIIRAKLETSLDCAIQVGR